MATVDNAFEDLWKAIKSTIPLNPEAAIYKQWRQSYAEWGSPLGKEVELDGGGSYQVFASAIVQWTPDGGVEVVTE